MELIIIILQIFLLIFLPLGIMKVGKKTGLSKALSDVVLCYGVGMLFANTQSLWLMDEDIATAIAKTSKMSVNISVLFAIPMLLMTMDVRAWFKHTGTIMKAFLLCVIAVILNAGITLFLFHDSIPDAANATGMLSAVFIGGTANMAAISQILDPKDTLFGILNATDTLCSGIYFLLLTAIGAKVYGFFLKKTVINTDDIIAETEKDTTPLTQQIGQVGIGILGAIAAIGLSVGIGFLANGFASLNEAVLMLALTTFGIFASLIPYYQNKLSIYNFAQYLLLIFALAAGSIADFSQIATYGTTYLYFTVFLLVGSILLQVLFCRIFGVDRDTFMITSTATIFGPPFIGQVASVLKNPSVVGGGMAMASLGLAAGNYLGYLIATLGAQFF